MSSSPLSIVVVAVAFVAAGGFLLILIRQLKAGKNVQPGACRLPPGPRPWPVVGNLVNLAILLRNGDVATCSSSDATKQKKPQPLHAALACLSRVYGPVIHLRLGWQQVVVLSSADAAREALRINDRSLAGRSSPAVYRVPWYVDHSMVWSGDDEPRWRHLRSLCRSHLMGAGRLDVHAGVRERKAWEMVGFLREEAKFGRTVKVADMVFRTVLDVFGWMMFSREDTAGGFHEGARGSVNWDIKKDMAKALELGKVPNLEDFFPSVFGGWDLQGIRKEIKQILKRSYAWFDEMVNQRKEEMKSQELQSEGREHASSQGSVVHRDDDFLDILLKAGVEGNPLKALLQGLITVLNKAKEIKIRSR